MNEYVPTTEEVRNRYLSEVFPEDEAEFDRWLTQIKAEAWDEGKEYGERRANREIPSQPNPYRKETK